jgi:DNA-directed RNA polymerase subunit RPC12/RpoP
MNYRCRSCGQVSDLAQMTRQSPAVNCPHCGPVGTINYKDRVTDHNPYQQAAFAGPVRKKAKFRASVGGRSGAAPPLLCVPDIIIDNTPHTTYYDDSADAGWQNTSSTKIRLAYEDLDPATQGMQGMVIVRGEIGGYAGAFGAGKLKEHFEAVADLMEANITGTSAAEGTGEAAAALGVVVYFANTYKMRWGRAQHAGAGIDQIWSKPTAGGTKYLIVEAKGPGQTCTIDNFQPGSIGTQMSKAWIIDRLAKMSQAGHNLATKILNELGLTVYVQYPNHSGGIISYYGIQNYNAVARTAKLRSVVITAKWTNMGGLSYVISGYTKLY